MSSNGKSKKVSKPYKDILNEDAPEGGALALKNRLILLRKWATKQAGITVHSAISVVNGEATDGTRNAPILTYEAPQPVPGAEEGSGGSSGNNASSEVRCGAIDSQADRAMYDRSIGCQVRTVRDLKKDEVALAVPFSAMVSPDLIAASDAGQALLACIQRENNFDFWEGFGVANQLESQQMKKIINNNGTQLIVKILQERKKVEGKVKAAEELALSQGGSVNSLPNKLVQKGRISQRAPFLAFLIHQRFANELNPSVASSTVKLAGDRPSLPEGAPKTFAPYARTLPASVCLPICWKRNELALLNGCIPGMPPLQNVTTRTMQLSSELIALIDAGLLHRFPSIFSPGMITWDRWVWAAAVYESRVVPANSLPDWVKKNTLSSTHVWEYCGAMIPFVDMLNHYDEPQVKWDMGKGSTSEKTELDGLSDSEDEADSQPKRLNLITLEKTKKHMQLYRNYGAYNNETFMTKFGFARMTNPSDKVKLAWALVDGVGEVSPPDDYEAVSEASGVPSSQLVFESSDADSVKAWWSEQRVALLSKALLGSEEKLDILKKGRKLPFFAFNNGKIDQTLLAVAVAATLPSDKILEWSRKSSDSQQFNGRPLAGVTLDKFSRNRVRMYFSFLFSRKLEKLLQNLNGCMKDHFNGVKLWTKATSGGLNYAGDETVSAEGETSVVTGWQSFFDTYAYNSTMEVEEKYYAMAPDSCVLTFYDGHVRSLQNTLDIMATDAVFLNKLKQQLEALGCTLLATDDTSPVAASQLGSAPAALNTDGSNHAKGGNSKSSDTPFAKKEGQGNGGGNGGSKRDRRQSKKGDRPSAIKLHIGNLSYQTLPNQLYDYFTRLYGKESVLECHIPTERDTGNSRGFGFVTMPEQYAKAALEANRSHEMEGRILKVAESNSAGTGKGGRVGGGGGGGGGGVGGGRGVPQAADRCSNCGYRPRWCTCNPNMAPMMGPPPDSFYGPGPPGPFMPPPMGPGFGQPHDMMDRRGEYGGGWGGRRSYSRSPSRDRRGGRGDRGYRRSYSRSRSRSYSRGRDRDRDRLVPLLVDLYLFLCCPYTLTFRDHFRRRRSDRSEERRRYDRSSRHYRSKSRSLSRPREIGGSPGRRNDDGGNFPSQPKPGRSLSRSRSPIDNAIDRPSSSSKKRDGKDSGGRGGGRSRSRDRGRYVYDCQFKHSRLSLWFILLTCFVLHPPNSRRRKRSKGSRRGKEKRRGSSRSRSR